MAARIRRENLLKDLCTRASARATLGQPSLSLAAAHGACAARRAGELAGSARPLAAGGLVEVAGDALRLTAEGRRKAEDVVRKHRLWEVYLTRRLELPSDHVHRDAEAMEHALSDADVSRARGAARTSRAVDPARPRRIPPGRTA